MSDGLTHYVKNGVSHAPAYQVSSIPWLTASVRIPPTTPTRYQLPFVTSFVSIRNDGASGAPAIRLGFSSAGVKTTKHYVAIPVSGSFTANYRVADIFVMSDTSANATGSIVCGLTGIDRVELRSNWSGTLCGTGIG